MKNTFTKTDATTKFATTDGLVTTVDTVVDAINIKLPAIVARAASTLPQTATTAYFTVTGRVLITDIVGEVTVELGAGENNLSLWSVPTVGAPVALCLDDGMDSDGDVVGTMYNITGTFTDAMIPTTSGAFTSQASSIVVSAGSISLKADASKGGQTKWTLLYIPLDAGATIITA